MLIHCTKRHLLTIDLVAAFVLFIFMLVLLRFLCCYHFAVNEDLYKRNGLRRSRKTGRDGDDCMSDSNEFQSAAMQRLEMCVINISISSSYNRLLPKLSYATPTYITTSVRTLYSLGYKVQS